MCIFKSQNILKILNVNKTSKILNLFQLYFAYALESCKNTVKKCDTDWKVRKEEINGKPRSETSHSSGKEPNTLDNDW